MASHSSLHHHQRIYLLNNGPTKDTFLSEQCIHNPHGPVRRFRPPILKLAGIVKGYATTGSNETVPAFPIFPDSFLLVVTIKEKKVDGFFPIPNCVIAELLDPIHMSIVASRNSGHGSTLLAIHPLDTTQMERINEMEGAICRHHFS